MERVESQRPWGDHWSPHPPRRPRRAVMPANPEPIGPQRQHEFHNLLAYVTGPDARSPTAYAVESTLCRRLLALGAMRWRRCFVTRAARRPAEPVTSPDGTRLTDHAQRPTTDEAVLGQGRFGRHAFTA